MICKVTGSHFSKKPGHFSKKQGHFNKKPGHFKRNRVILTKKPGHLKSNRIFFSFPPLLKVKAISGPLGQNSDTVPLRLPPGSQQMGHGDLSVLNPDGSKWYHSPLLV